MISVNDVTAGIGKTLGESIATPKNKYVKGFTDFIFNKLYPLLTYVIFFSPTLLTQLIWSLQDTLKKDLTLIRYSKMDC